MVASRRHHRLLPLQPAMTFAGGPVGAEMAVRREKCRHPHHNLHAIERQDSEPETGAGTW